MEGKQFKPVGRADAEHAMSLIEEARCRYKSRPAKEK
jgi:hypothetical protein